MASSDSSVPPSGDGGALILLICGQLSLHFSRTGKAKNASFLGPWAFQHGEVGLRYFSFPRLN
jgi:hypothetical protein